MLKSDIEYFQDGDGDKYDDDAAGDDNDDDIVKSHIDNCSVYVRILH